MRFFLLRPVRFIPMASSFVIRNPIERFTNSSGLLPPKSERRFTCNTQNENGTYELIDTVYTRINNRTQGPILSPFSGALSGKITIPSIPFRVLLLGFRVQFFSDNSMHQSRSRVYYTCYGWSCMNSSEYELNMKEEIKQSWMHIVGLTILAFIFKMIWTTLLQYFLLGNLWGQFCCSISSALNLDL